MLQGDYHFTQTFDLSKDDMSTMLYDGRIDPITYEAYDLYHDLIMYARFDRPMAYAYNKEPLQVIYAYLIARLIMMRIMPFIYAYPRQPKYKFTSDMNKHIAILYWR